MNYLFNMLIMEVKFQIFYQEDTAEDIKSN